MEVNHILSFHTPIFWYKKTDFVCIIFNTIFEIWHILPFTGYLICLCSPYSFGNIVIFIQVRIMK